MSDENDLNDGEGIKSLRKEYEQLKKDLAAEREANAKFRTRERQETVAEILKAKGAPAGAARLYSGEDTSEDAVGKWLEENKDLFPVSSGNGATDANTQSVQRVAEASFGNVNSIQNGPDAARVLGDPEAIMHAIKTLPYDELVKLGYMPPNGQLFTPPAR